jgi:hypothetical protein
MAPALRRVGKSGYCRKEQVEDSLQERAFTRPHAFWVNAVAPASPLNF